MCGLELQVLLADWMLSSAALGCDGAGVRAVRALPTLACSRVRVHNLVAPLPARSLRVVRCKLGRLVADGVHAGVAKSVLDALGRVWGAPPWPFFPRFLTEIPHPPVGYQEPLPSTGAGCSWS